MKLWSLSIVEEMATIFSDPGAQSPGSWGLNFTSSGEVQSCTWILLNIFLAEFESMLSRHRVSIHGSWWIDIGEANVEDESLATVWSPVEETFPVQNWKVWIMSLENLEAAREQGFLQVDGEVVGKQLDHRCSLCNEYTVRDLDWTRDSW